MSKISADTVEAKTTNGDLVLQGNGTGVPDLASGTKLNGTALTDTFSTQSPVGANLIINGDMRIAQRGTVTGLTATGYGGADRFSLGITTIGTWTLQQTVDGPDGFSTCQEAVCTTADASPAAGDAVIMQHKFEGLNVQHLNYGSAQAETVTVSFWCKSDKTGTVVAELYQADGPYQVSQSFTIDVADTWEQKTLTFAGNTLGAITDDNTVGLQFNIWLDAGTNFTSGTLNTSWAARTNADRAAGLTLALADATSNYFRLTGVKLEVGSTATAFVPDDYATALAKCQRYYFNIDGMIGTGWVSNTNQAVVAVHFPVDMRTDPSQSSTSPVGTVNYRSSSTVLTVVSTSAQDSAGQFVGLTGTGSVLTLGDSVGGILTSGTINFDAEL